MEKDNLRQLLTNLRLENEEERHKAVERAAKIDEAFKAALEALDTLDSAGPFQVITAEVTSSVMDPRREQWIRRRILEGLTGSLMNHFEEAIELKQEYLPSTCETRYTGKLVIQLPRKE